jgi:translation elongation factor EF-G
MLSLETISMARVLTGSDDFAEPDELGSEFAIQIIVPEEFAGVSMSELQSRRGCITGMDIKSGSVLIRASLPASEYEGLEKAIDEGTQHRGRVEHAPGQ